MKITLTGAAGNITKPLAEKLLAAGHQVTVIGRNAENLKSLTDKGSVAKIGSITDPAFVEDAFAGSDVVYTMIPAPYHEPEWIDYSYNIGKNYANAILSNGIKKAVNLSTYGAHRQEGIGPINSIAQLERALNELTDVTIIHLRAARFYSNFFAQIAAIKQFGVLGSSYNGNVKMIFAHTNDIADAAFKAIHTNELDKQSPYYVVSDVATFNEVATEIGLAIHKDLKWTELTDEELKSNFQQIGFPDFLVEKIFEIEQQTRSGILTEHYFSLQNKPELGKTKLKDFAKEFAAVYNS